MNHIAEEIRAVVEEGQNDLMHYGTKRHSGRYPWGSGDEPYQRSGDFISRYESLEKSGLSEKEIANAMKMSTTDLRMQLRVAKHERKRLEYDRARSLKEDGLTPTEIGRIMGKNESSIRSMLEEGRSVNVNKATKTADILEKELQKKKFLDIGTGVERELGVSEGVLKEAAFILETRGYAHFGVGMPQTTNSKQRTTMDILALPKEKFPSEEEVKSLQKEIYNDYGLIKSVGDYHTKDGGLTYNKLEYPTSIDSSRVQIRYGDQGGASKDGVIEIRRGVPDLDLGNSHYAQVRIMVDNTHYIKGMAIYSDNIPDGADIMFNTNKKSGTDKMKVLKPINDADPDNPFGANIKANGQSKYIDKDGNEKLSAINKLKEEGDWDTDSSKTLSSQFLSKQPMSLIKKQLKLTYADAEAEYKAICELENPTIKRQLLMDFADNCDSATVHLKAAALPRQKTQVILPLDNIKDTEIYAPNFRNGETVSLIRYPHGGTFEIPTLTVNNRNKEGKNVLGNTKDAVGINVKVAERLSGADFDGDTVVVIPWTNKVQIKSTRPLKELEGFDPKTEYSTEGKTNVSLIKTEAFKQKQMGIVSNLITDMTLGGAKPEEIARAVKHSMVVIDAKKHKLDYKQSEKDNGIEELRRKYQRRALEDGTIKEGGAATLIARKKQEVEVPETKGSGRIDPETGKVIYKNSGRKYYDKNGNLIEATKKVSLMSTIDDAYSISTGTPQENEYADYVNKMKALANTARKEYLKTGNLIYSPSANKTYEKEVNHLLAQLNEAEKNAPRERQANAIANSIVKAKSQSNPGMDKKELKKLKQREITNARLAVGARSKEVKNIVISPKEWEAIQAGAITDSRLTKILKYTDKKVIREYATPKTVKELSPTQVNRAKALANSGYTYQEIADIMGKSTSAISNYLNS